MAALAFRDGEFAPFEDMSIGIGTHAFHYGTSVFEGIRAYWSPEGRQLYVFRPEDHYERLLSSARFFAMELPYSVDDLCAVTVDLLSRSRAQQDVYVRPILFKSSAGIGLWRDGLEDSFVIFHVPMGEYIAGEGVRCCVSSWRRTEGNAAPARAKIGGLYAAMSLARLEAMRLGFDEAITLTASGRVAEGTAENIFLVVDGKLVTPARGEDLLAGITRSSVIQLAGAELGIDVVERSVNRSELYFAEEVFLCGTAAEVTAVLEIDGRPIADGKAGEVTRAVRDLYLDVAHGNRAAYANWCRPVYGGGDTT